MAKIIWTEPALSDLDAVADYIALENPAASTALVRNVFRRADQLIEHPQSSSRPQELHSGRYRQVIEPPCRILYRVQKDIVYILYVMRTERKLRRNP